MRQKILAFLTDGEKFLTLRNNSKDKSHGGDFWFTVTGSVEGDESLESAVKREVKEETNLDVKDIFNLNWGSIYAWFNVDCEEHNFLAYVNKNKIELNEEHTDYQWLSPDDFVNKISWGDDKELLKKVLEKALKMEKFFSKFEIVDFRKKKLSL